MADESIAVPLDLVQPIGAGRRLLDEGRETRSVRASGHYNLVQPGALRSRRRQVGGWTRHGSVSKWLYPAVGRVPRKRNLVRRNSTRERECGFGRGRFKTALQPPTTQAGRPSLGLSKDTDPSRMGYYTSALHAARGTLAPFEWLLLALKHAVRARPTGGKTRLAPCQK